MNIPKDIIEHLKVKNLWFDDASLQYQEALIAYGLPLISPIVDFYIHAEGGPNFITPRGELLQIGWALLNTNYINNASKLRKALGLDDDFVFLDAFEAEGGYIYKKNSRTVIEFKISNNEKSYKEWASFNDFLRYFFDIQ